MAGKTPERMCVGCRESKSKKELIRVVRVTKKASADVTEGVAENSEDLYEVKIDKTGRMNGRGAYICPDKECLERAVKTKAISRALMINISDEVYDELSKEI